MQAYTHFQSVFDVSPRRDLDNPWAALVGEVRAWIKRKENSQPGSEFFVGGRWTSPSRAVVETRALAGDGPTPEMWAVRYEHRDAQVISRRWVTNVGVAEIGQREWRVAIVLLHHLRAGYVGRELRIPQPSSPRFVTRLLDSAHWIGRVGSVRLTGTPMSVEVGKGAEFVALLTDPRRLVPIVLVSRDRKTSQPRLDPATLSRALAGTTVVHVCESPECDEEMEYLLPRPFRCPNGTVRIYAPGVELANDWTSSRHRFFTSQDIDEQGCDEVTGQIVMALTRTGVWSGLQSSIMSIDDIDARMRERRLTARGESRSYEGSTQSIRRTTLTRMAMGTRETDQPPLWIATSDLPTSPGHPFYARLTTLLDGHHFDRFVEGLCDRFYAPVMGRPSLAPGRYFRLLLVGYFEGIDSERGIAWRATDSLAVRSFLRLAVDEAPPDHSTIARTRRLIDLETHRTVFTWVQQRLVEAGRLTGKTIAIDATTLEANAAMRSIVRRDTGESYQAFLAGLATASGVETPTREGLARLDRKRKKKTSNTDWTNPHDPDAKVTKMKDGRTHLAHKAEHAVDMETGAIVAVTLQGADVGDTTTIIETAIAATEQVEDAQANVDDRQSLEEIVGDKGYHSNQTLIDLDAVGIRSYVSEPDRGRRDWSKDPEARAPVYGNRRRMRGRRGRRLMRQRGERIERSFAHLYDTGGMRRTHLRGHTNILKRLLIHAGGFNLGLVMRHLIGIGTPRGLQGRVAAVLATLGVLMGVVRRRLTTISSSHRLIPAVRGRLASLATFAVNSSAAITCTTGC